jgi:transcriptional regulator with PAS, ATPase and Fis domain
VRVVAATNVEFSNAIRSGKFREDLYYRLNQVPVYLPPLRDRKEDIPLLFAKFTSDFAEKYKMPSLELTPEARELMVNYSWPGNIRQLKNITEQINVLEQERTISADTLRYYLPHEGFGAGGLIVAGQNSASAQNFTEREILYKVLFDMKNDLNDLKQLVSGMMQSGSEFVHDASNAELVQRVFAPENNSHFTSPVAAPAVIRLPQTSNGTGNNEQHIHVEESLSLQNSEKDLIERALKKHRNKRKYAAEELGISERTLYRKIKEYNLAK